MSSPIGTPPNPQWETENSEEWRAAEGIVSSSDHSQPDSAGGPSRAKKKARFTGGEDPDEQNVTVSWIDPLDGASLSPEPASGYISPTNSEDFSPRQSRSGSGDMQLPRVTSRSHLPDLTPQQTREIHEAFGQTPPTSKPRPAMRRAESGPAAFADEDAEWPDEDGQRAHRNRRMREAFERGKRLENDERSDPNSRHDSPERRGSDGIELDNLDRSGRDDSDEEEMPTLKRAAALSYYEARRLVRKHGRRRHRDYTPPPPGYRSGAATPTAEQQHAQDYRPQPDEYRGGVLGMLLHLYHNQDEDSPGHSAGHSRASSMARLLPRMPRSRGNSETPTPQHSPPDSGTATPSGGRSLRELFARGRRGQSAPSLAQLVGTSATLGSPIVSGLGEKVSERMKEQKEAGLGGRSHSSTALAAFHRMTGHQKRVAEENRITKHIAETINRQKYLMRLCKALMLYGAPTHRLEEYMRMSARVLEIEAQFLYIPGSMIMSFDDFETHTTEVKLVRVSQGLDLGRLRDVHEVYKDVVHDRVYLEEATRRLKEVNARKPKYSRWLRVPVYGMAALTVGPFAFEARWIDLPIAFLLGCGLGVLQLIAAPASDLYANIFEISAAVITSFLARAFGSIPYKGGRLFCFSALAQSSIALILPGYIVLTASLELQSKSIVAGSVRMVYAIIYSLFLGYGITIGATIWGLMYKDATSETTCSNPLPSYWNFLFVPAFTICLTIINQAKWKQTPVMVFIAMVGYITNFYSSKRFAGNTQVSSTLGALAIGVMANVYSRVGSRVENWALDRWEDDLRPWYKRARKHIFRVQSNKESPKKLEEGAAKDDESTFERSRRRVGYGLAAAAMLPAIFVQVPSGLSGTGSLVSGIASANQITGNGTNGTTTLSSTTLSNGDSRGLNTVAFNVSYSVIQIAIGITVGLFLSALVVYPFGKRRSGLFSL